jgi:hypothetical protein
MYTRYEWWLLCLQSLSAATRAHTRTRSGASFSAWAERLCARDEHRGGDRTRRSIVEAGGLTPSRSRALTTWPAAQVPEAHAVLACTSQAAAPVSVWDISSGQLQGLLVCP